MKRILGQALYGLLFVVALPLLLAAWAAAAAPSVPLPVPSPSVVWAALLIAGVALIAAGMVALVVYGQGLPMNAYPPRLYVTQGVYRLASHPIYVGFVVACAAAFMLAQSPSGIWLVTPVVALAAAALVLGYERHDLRRRFGTGAIRTPWISLPPDSGDAVRRQDRISVYVLVAIPWAVAFEAVCGLGIPSAALVAALPFERAWPVVEWTEWAYGSAYLFVLATPFVVRTRRDLRSASVLGLVATAVVTLVYVSVPVISPPRPFVPTTLAGQILTIERSMCHTVAAFPSFHVIWALIAARAWTTRSPAWGIAGSGWAALIAVTCVTTGMHALADVVAAILAFAVLVRYRRIWEWMRATAERIANSWYEWRWHGVRVLGYSAYAGLAAAVSFWLTSALAGRAMFADLVLVHAFGLVGAGAWAQQLEGSPKLARPYGYYGGVIGIAAGIVVAGLLGGDVRVLLAVMAVAGPWVQAIGRLRCLVQGCCHGAAAPEWVGIRYRNPRSRVCALGDLAGVPLHPTPLYSIISNVVVGILLLRLWSLGAGYTLVAGVYLTLSGISRFVEESLRGEPQTPIVWGLRLYQWMAVGSLVTGALLTTMASGRTPGLTFALDPRAAIGGAICGLIVAAAMGVDFPASSRRFARLAPP
jgi:protein-S-isoprenylcysteine O-methyltransferase Ste14